MAFLKWHAALSVQVERFDEQHKVLVGLLNDLHSAIMEGRGNAALGGVLGGVTQYAVTHFADEERLMLEHAYPGLTEHRAEHAKLVAQVEALKARFRAGQAALTVDVMVFLKDWLVNHIQGADRKYGSYFRARGVR